MKTNRDKKIIRTINEFQNYIGKGGKDLFIQIQRLLLQGDPVKIEHAAKVLNVSVEHIKQIIIQFGETNQRGDIVGVLGISFIPTPYKFKVKNKLFYTWCALDALLFPEMLEIEAEIESIDYINGVPVKLLIEKNLLQWTDPAPLFISVVNNIDDCDIRKNFCNRVHFFASEKTADKWLTENVDGEILLVGDFFEYTLGEYSGCC